MVLFSGCITHLEYGAYSEGCIAHHIKILKELALRDGVQGTDSASTRPWWDVDVSQEVCDAVVQWLLTHKIISSERPWTKGGIGVNGEERAKLIALEEMRKQDRERYKALVIVGGTLNSLEKQHLDGHRADGFIKALSEQLEDQLHMVLTHRLSATVGKSIDTAANMGLNAYMETCEAETQRQTEAALKELRKHSVLFKFPDKKPVQPWEMDRLADEPEYVPYSQRYAPPGGGSGLGFVKPEYRWLTTASGTQAPSSAAVSKPTPKPAVASGKAPEGVDSIGAIGDILRKEKMKADSEAHLKQTLSQPLGAAKSSGKPASAFDILIPPVAGSVAVAPMHGFNPAMAIPALGNPATAAGAAGIAVMLGMDYQTQRREVDLAYEGWRKGDASLLPDMVWSQPAAREMMEQQMGYPFGRPDLAPSAVTCLESPLPTWAPQACGGLNIPVQGKPEPLITPIPAPRMPEPMVTPIPAQKRPDPMITPVCDAPAGLTEGFDIHRPTLDDLVMYKKGDKPGTTAVIPRAGAQSSAAGGNPDPDWEPEDDKFDPTKEEVKDYKKSDFQKGDNIGLHRFTQKVNSRTWKDPKSGQYIEKDRALNTGARPHGPSRWKLYDRFERLLGTITKDGSFYKGPPK